MLINRSNLAAAVATANAGTATKLATARNVNGVPFDGTANINPVSAATVGPNFYTPGYVSGQYYFCNSPSSSGSSALITNRVRVSPWVVTRHCPSPAYSRSSPPLETLTPYFGSECGTTTAKAGQALCCSRRAPSPLAQETQVESQQAERLAYTKSP
jgi:hypothetical protein